MLFKASVYTVTLCHIDIQGSKSEKLCRFLNVSGVKAAFHGETENV